MGKNKIKLSKQPFVSICTPTFNRRPFIPVIIKCFENDKCSGSPPPTSKTMPLSL